MTMATNQDYRAHAEECLRMASKATDKAAARWFRMLADDYLEMADRPGPRPKEHKPKDGYDHQGGSGKP